MTHNPRAFIFDLDGVITDTAEYHYLAWKELAGELGIAIDRAFNEQLKGISRIESLERILALDPSNADISDEEKERLATKKNEHYKELTKSISPDDILPGIEQLIRDIREQGMKVALGSASKNASLIIKQLGLSSQFDYIVDAAKVSKGKPDPETFTTAADYLGIPYSECIGVEDAAAGVDAINGGGMFSVGVGSSDSLGHADYVVDDTSKLSFGKIIEQYRAATVK